MGSDAVIYVPSFIKIGSGVKKLIGGIYRHTHRRTATRSHKRTLTDTYLGRESLVTDKGTSFQSR
jgi:hypothetical protein